MVTVFSKAALGEAVLIVAQANFILAGNVTKGDVVIASAHTADGLPTVVIGTDAAATVVGVAMKTGVTGEAIPVLMIGIIVVTAGAGGVVLGEAIEAAATGHVEDGAGAGIIIGRGLQTIANTETGIVWVNCAGA